MNESITKRVSRIISGSFNALVNKLENSLPDIVMEEAIREIESVVDEVRLELGKVIAARHLSNKRLAEKNNGLEELSQKIEFAISENRDDLAKVRISLKSITHFTLSDHRFHSKSISDFTSNRSPSSLNAIRPLNSERSLDFNQAH